MRHISLDESFWRCATEALVSGESIEDVEPSLLDVSRLLRHLCQPVASGPGGRLGLLTLGGTEEERALGLTLAALLARRGCRVLLADCDFTDQTWSRLLGAEEPDGIADHVGYGTPPRRLVRRTSWAELALLPSGTTALDPAGILRSDKLQSCLDTAGRGHDLVCVGLPFDETLEWGKGAAAGMDRAILVGPAGEELAFELAIPRLVRRLELLVTLDVPPLGRWRPALGAALPALTQMGVTARSEGRGDRPAPWSSALPDSSAPNGAAAVSSPGEPVVVALSPDAGLLANQGSLPPVLSELRHPAEAGAPRRDPELPLVGAKVGAARGADRESAADVAFLESLPRGETPPASADAAPPVLRASLPPPSPPLVHPRLRAVALQQQLELATSAPDATAEEDLRELAQGWSEVDETLERGPAEPEIEDRDSGRSVWLTALAVLLCLVLGAGAFWFWRASQQMPEGQFSFVDSADQGLNDRAAAAVGGADAAGRGTSAEAPSSATEALPPSDAAAAAGVGGPVGGAAGSEGQGTTAAGAPAGAPAQSAGGPEAAPPAVSYEPPTNGPLLSYSLHVGSYQTFDAAQRAALALRARGLDAFVAPVLLEGKGEWHRVFVDALPDAPASQQSLARARQGGAVAEGAVRETPWALYLGTFATRALAQELIARLARSGISGYAVGADPVHVYAGAFEAAGDAEILNRQLRDRGFESALVRRRGVETR